MPAQFDSLGIAALAAGGVVVCAAAYAVCYALGRLSASRGMVRLGFVAYAGVVACAALLADSLSLRGAWLALVPLLLVGYLFAPMAVWRLTLAVHGDVAHSHAARRKRGASR